MDIIDEIEFEQARSPMRKTFEAEIQHLKDELLLMGSMVEQQILDSVESLKKRDIDASRQIYNADGQKSTLSASILKKHVMIVIATQQPMAHDLRLLASILEVSG
jgi:phosphate transport system protein